MSLTMSATLRLLLALVVMVLASSLAPINIVANVRGKRYEISAETVQEVNKQIESLTGISAGEQNVLYKGKVLSTSDKLEDMGVTAGEVLNVIKGRRVRPTSAAPIEQSSKPPSVPTFNPDDIKADPEKLKEAMAAMDTLLDSNAIEEYFADEERIEEARQQLIDNIDQYEQMMPGFKNQALEIASDANKWKEAMNNAKTQLLKLKKERDALKGEGKSSQSPPHPAETGIDDIDEDP